MIRTRVSKTSLCNSERGRLLPSRDVLLRVPGRQHSRLGDFVSKMASVCIFGAKRLTPPASARPPLCPSSCTRSPLPSSLNAPTSFPPLGPVLVLIPKMQEPGPFCHPSLRLKVISSERPFPTSRPRCRPEPPSCPFLLWSVTQSTIYLFICSRFPRSEREHFPPKAAVTCLFRGKPQDPDCAWGPRGGGSHKPPKSPIENILVFAAFRFL